jgi:hypothetical protein
MPVEQARVVSSREVLIAGLDDKQAAGWGTAVGATIAGTAAYGITKADNPALSCPLLDSHLGMKRRKTEKS